MDNNRKRELKKQAMGKMEQPKADKKEIPPKAEEAAKLSPEEIQELVSMIKDLPQEERQESLESYRNLMDEAEYNKITEELMSDHEQKKSEIADVTEVPPHQIASTEDPDHAAEEIIEPEEVIEQPVQAQDQKVKALRQALAQPLTLKERIRGLAIQGILTQPEAERILNGANVFAETKKLFAELSRASSHKSITVSPEDTSSPVVEPDNASAQVAPPENSIVGQETEVVPDKQKVQQEIREEEGRILVARIEKALAGITRRTQKIKRIRELQAITDVQTKIQAVRMAFIMGEITPGEFEDIKIKENVEEALEEILADLREQDRMARNLLVSPLLQNRLEGLVEENAVSGQEYQRIRLTIDAAMGTRSYDPLLGKPIESSPEDVDKLFKGAVTIHNAIRDKKREEQNRTLRVKFVRAQTTGPMTLETILKQQRELEEYLKRYLALPLEARRKEAERLGLTIEEAEERIKLQMESLKQRQELREKIHELQVKAQTLYASVWSGRTKLTEESMQQLVKTEELLEEIERAEKQLFFV